jgi:chorismate mutase
MITDTQETAAVRPDPAVELEDQLGTLRGQIDALDTAIQALVQERIEVSHRIQRARMNAGGTRVQLGRERIVHAAYRDALGPEGSALADALLLVCRGR